MNLESINVEIQKENYLIMAKSMKLSHLLRRGRRLQESSKHQREPRHCQGMRW